MASFVALLDELLERARCSGADINPSPVLAHQSGPGAEIRDCGLTAKP